VCCSVLQCAAVCCSVLSNGLYAAEGLQHKRRLLPLRTLLLFAHPLIIRAPSYYSLTCNISAASLLRHSGEATFWRSAFYMPQRICNLSATSLLRRSVSIHDCHDLNELNETSAHMQNKDFFYSDTGWWRLTGCLKLQVIFRKRATDSRALLWKMTYEDKASYGSSPLCISIHGELCFGCFGGGGCATNINELLSIWVKQGFIQIFLFTASFVLGGRVRHKYIYIYIIFFESIIVHLSETRHDFAYVQVTQNDACIYM